jgi:sugar phosphate isomerase/epimerase
LDKSLLHFYAWEHGEGCMQKRPKVLEMKQMPGYGPLDFTPVLESLKKINYSGYTSIFMHPVPRGIPILPTAKQVTAAMNRSREYLTYCLDKI